MSPLVCAVFWGFLLVCGYLFWLWRRGKQWRDVLNKIPGPKGRPFVGNAWEMLTSTGQERFQNILRWSRMYNGIFRVLNVGASGNVVISRPELVEEFLSSSVHIDKGASYRSFLMPWLGEGLLISSGEKWKYRRRLLTPTFHFKILNDFVQVFVEEARKMVSRLEDHQDRVFDIYPYLSAFTLDTICRTAMGQSLDVQKGEGSSYVQACVRISKLIQNRVWSPWQWHPWLYSLTPSGREHKKCLDILHGFTNRVIEEKLRDIAQVPQSPEGKPKKRLRAFLDMLVDAYLNGEISKEGIREEVDTFMFEGHDTTASGLCWSLFLIGSHPDVQERLVSEVEEFFESCTEDAITPEELKKMTYFDCVIRECLRLYPPVPLFGRQLKQETIIDKYTVPKGAGVAICPTALHWNPDVWPEPMKFDPDRFLRANAEGRHPFAYVPFSGGLRNCIGQRFALFEMKVLLAFVLRRYKVDVKPQTFEELKPVGQLVMRPKDGMWVKLTSRK